MQVLNSIDTTYTWLHTDRHTDIRTFLQAHTEKYRHTDWHKVRAEEWVCIKNDQNLQCHISEVIRNSEPEPIWCEKKDTRDLTHAQTIPNRYLHPNL